MQTCTNHPYAADAQPCESCGQPFCEHCRVEIMGRQLCSACKQGAVAGIMERKRQHPLALWSLLTPLGGYLLCGFLVPITGPLGIYLGTKVLREIEAQGTWGGRSLALAGIATSVGTLLPWVLSVIAIVLFRLGVL